MAIEDAPLPQQMRWAAEVAKVAGQRDQLDPNWWTWAAHVFVRRADEWEAEDRAAAERDVLVQEVARQVWTERELWVRGDGRHGGFDPLCTSVQWAFHVARRLVDSGLIADGWTKDGAK